MKFGEAEAVYRLFFISFKIHLFKNHAYFKLAVYSPRIHFVNLVLVCWNGLMCIG
jgi:hypothetical protein